MYSTADRDGLWVRLADRAVCIGPHPPAESYLNISNLIAAAETTGCDSVHPGLGLSGRERGIRAGLRGQRPDLRRPAAPTAIETMGDKSAAKAAMRLAGVPLVPGSQDGCRGPDEAAELAAEIGYPVLLKAVSGGGGRGMRVVESDAEIADAYRLASAEAASAFGDGDMYLEKAIIDPRHVEMQVLADRNGDVLVLGERDCSVQRRHQKLIEEGPSPALDQPTREQMAEAARLALRWQWLRQRRHRRVPARYRGQVLIHRDEHPAPGRASGVGAGHRASIWRWLQLRIAGGRAAAPDRAGRRCVATRSSFESTARIPATTSGPPRARCRASGHRWARACGSTPTPTRATRCRRSTTRCWPS